MLSPSSTVPRCASIAGWSPPLLGGVLAGLGLVLLAGGGGAIDWPAAPVPPAAAPAVGRDAVPIQAIPPLPGRRGRYRAGDGMWADTGEMDRPAAKRSRRPTECLGADLATGHRAESVHLAKVPVYRLADCGDVRDVLRGVAALPRVGRDGDGARSGSDFADAALAETADVDLAAAALYGPPDRHPQPTQEALLEETVATRFLAP